VVPPSWPRAGDCRNTSPFVWGGQLPPRPVLGRWPVGGRGKGHPGLIGGECLRCYWHRGNEQSASDSLDLIVSPGVQSFPGTYVRDSDNCWTPFPNSCPNELQLFSNSGTITNDVAD